MAFDFDKAFHTAAGAADTDEEVQGVQVDKAKTEQQEQKPAVQEEQVQDTQTERVEQPQKPRIHNVEGHNINAEFIHRIVELSDTIRNFDDKTEHMAELFFETKDTNEILLQALEQDSITLDAFAAILDVNNAKGVDKAFYLVDLHDDLLKEIGRVLGLLGDEQLTFKAHNQYCREIEENISAKDASFMESLQAFLQLLGEAQPQSDGRSE